MEEKYRLEGVELMNRKSYFDAYVHYSEAIAQTKNKDYLIKFQLNKAIVCFKLSRHP